MAEYSREQLQRGSRGQEGAGRRIAKDRREQLEVEQRTREQLGGKEDRRGQLVEGSRIQK